MNLKNGQRHSSGTGYPNTNYTGKNFSWKHKMILSIIENDSKELENLAMKKTGWILHKSGTLNMNKI